MYLIQSNQAMLVNQKTFLIKPLNMKKHIKNCVICIGNHFEIISITHEMNLKFSIDFIK